MGTLSKSAATDLGRALRFVRTATGEPLREVAPRAQLSMQYLQNIERGERLSANPLILSRLAGTYGLPRDAFADLYLRARVLSALEDRGIPSKDAALIWRSVEARMAEVGYPPKTSLTDIVAMLIERGGQKRPFKGIE